MKLLLVSLSLIFLVGCNYGANHGFYDDDTFGEKYDPTVITRTDVSSQHLTSLPSDVLLQVNLQELNISHNDISGALPAEIRKLSKLKILYANDNRMTGVPAEIGQLSQLEMLSFKNNQLTGLPHEIGNLTHLKELDLRGNNIAEQDLKIIREKLPNTQIRLLQFD